MIYQSNKSYIYYYNWKTIKWCQVSKRGKTKKSWFIRNEKIKKKLDTNKTTDIIMKLEGLAK